MNKGILKNVMVSIATVIIGLYIVSCGHCKYESYIISICDYKNLNIEKINIEVTPDEIIEEKKYYLEPYATLENIENKTIKSGDIVSVKYSLYDSEKKKIVKYTNLNTEFIVGENEFDKDVERKIIGHNVGDVLTKIPYNKTQYVTLSILRAKESVYPKLTSDFLYENFEVSTEKQFNEMVENEVKKVKFEERFEDVTDSLLKSIIQHSKFSDRFYKNVKERYQEIIDSYISYGKLYNLSLDEVLQLYNLDYETVYKNAEFNEGSWEVAQYIIRNEKLKPNAKEYTRLLDDYANENGYSSERELIKDNGKKYVKEQIYIKIVKKFLYNYNVKK